MLSETLFKLFHICCLDFPAIICTWFVHVPLTGPSKTVFAPFPDAKLELWKFRFVDILYATVLTTWSYLFN